MIIVDTAEKELGTETDVSLILGASVEDQPVTISVAIEVFDDGNSAMTRGGVRTEKLWIVRTRPLDRTA